MGEESVSSVFRVLMYFMLIIIVLFVSMFLYNVNSANKYINECNVVVTRSGGLTNDAYKKCNTLSQKYFHGYYHVSHLNNLTGGYEKNKNNSYNYINKEEPFGHKTVFYVYSDVPFYNHMIYHSGKFQNTNHSPIKESVSSSIRAGSQN